jgi:predicted nucleotidyltransferase component of viral defense system
MELGDSTGSPRTILGGGAMKISPEKLAAEAEATGFRPDVLEKVAQLLGLLDALRSHPFLKGKLVLKGGTALSLFVFEVPRLSVDIDLINS